MISIPSYLLRLLYETYFGSSKKARGKRKKDFNTKHGEDLGCGQKSGSCRRTKGRTVGNRGRAGRPKRGTDRRSGRAAQGQRNAWTRLLMTLSKSGSRLRKPSILRSE